MTSAFRKPSDTRMHRIAHAIATKSEHKALAKKIEEYYQYRGDGYSLESMAYQFLCDAVGYLKAVEQRRIYCIIRSVSKSGMSRIMDFGEFSINKTKFGHGNYCTFYSFLGALGYNYLKDRDGYRISGCGMDMVFHTNYSIVHNLESIGLINKSVCASLSQMTPTCL